MKKFLFTSITPAKLWVAIFLICCVESIYVQKYYLPMHPDLHGGDGLFINDATFFHSQAKKIAENINLNGWKEWHLVGSDFSGNVGILSAIYAIFGPNPIYFIPINVAAHATGLTVLYVLGEVLWPGRTGKIAGFVSTILFLIFPSSMVWFTQNHKDAFSISGTLILILAWVKILSNTKEDSISLKSVILLTLSGGVLIAVVRSYLIIIVSFGFAVCYLIILLNKSRANKNLLLLSLFMAIIIMISLGGSFLPTSDLALRKNIAVNQNNEEFCWTYSAHVPKIFEKPLARISMLRAHFIEYGIKDEGKSNFDVTIEPNNMIDALIYTPRALVHGLFEPLPSTWFKSSSIMKIDASIETAVWYILFIGLFITLYKNPTEQVITGFILSVTIITIYSYTNPNVGTLYRVRYGLWMYLGLNGVLGWTSILIRTKKLNEKP
jgi:putative peptidoglycan lipid II flippase